MTTLAEHMIAAGAENRHPCLIKLTEQEKLQDDCNVQATNIVLHGLPPDVYSLVNHCQAAKDIWDIVKLLMQGTELSYQECKCKLYNEFDKFTSAKGELLYEYYLRFAQLINDMHITGMTMQQVQVNTKFLNALQPEWSKFLTDVKLAKNMYNTNYDQLYAYLGQHKGHANEARLLRERYPDTLALVANHQTQSHSAQYPQQLSSTPQPTQLSYTLPSVPQNLCDTPPITQQPQAEFSQLDSGLAVPSFLPGDDPIACLNKAMTFMSTIIASHFPSTNNQLRTSSNLRNQATIQDGRGNATSSRGNNAAGHVRFVKCYNYQGEGHMARQCTKPKRPRNSTWFKEKMLLVQAQESGQVLDEEQLAFSTDFGIADGQDTQTTIIHNAAFQIDDLDAYDSDCDDISSIKAVLMANLSSYGSDVLYEVPQHDTYQNDNMLNQSVQET
ncbi:retrovirus-related pol polyprotein from transposon TNT 1-94 [Tanacetum coccineum]|uniref:Retrovirus-related pol polyprotein from transposon TNT 1-94 n=1 Tax=Tanacetum coccineum TaxID=301880 RepID=A0ABQ4Y5T5_9ASTR